ncbi:hypothetical protein COW36_04085 [bacterium (Candidatus Blackallbacteria) CG17_big_fil_post_rev_8_21_14_2_50_48_46]|uniref:S1/P1 Nuclease n=1 Tax=bacterium (Candidatus Blackallbacteria) CG17_big_fil_post_rev_8_21_14_2_50_48_46 TaxID=2014261 RepID=A0A2M7G8R0_9BACT|nr:MAG: hypothetical protein COW64_04860 [bacterium (Candidatus Blackallbacteria) CG18_big_fil_WC_8_21_14_2_50_49_26]PIW18477.1 MAG: hypothetical protein COW36_04085 [bacterium (Candidatus Blackallbacteria) CG17_big_fil_post_rev_8_21_14_2_50_48_46]PIW46538.1 MAG: hypothetical protein COW20_16595 [bacterium (Candidatus Blackallbacteria) CG13_big_fil_rev_8_21_14_2_50_49_14]
MKNWFSKLALSVLAGCSFLSAISSPAYAWWDTGHMITAWIAYQELRPAVRTEADRLIQLLDFADDLPQKRHFVPVSVWMDETKARGLKTFDNWHYANIPYNPEGLLALNAVPESNIIKQIDSLSKTLENPKATDFERAFALRILIHLVGDIHQPFHAVSRSDHAHPDGDQGGNLVKLEGVPQNNLHFFWDSTANYFPSVKSETWAGKIPSMAEEVLKKYPLQGFSQNLSYDPQAWAQESYKLAVQAGYEALPLHGPLSEKYIRQAQEICLVRLALGGHRLAELLNQRIIRK